jgi:hypothetical protein
MLKRFAVVLTASLMAAPAFAGALMLDVGAAKTNPEALRKNAVFVARTAACKSPEKTIVTAAAEGVIAGKRQTIPLRVTSLAEPGAYAVSQQWPHEGIWAVKIVATNPDYGDYSTGIVVPVRNEQFSRAAAKQFSHAPTAGEVDAVLKQATLD